MRRTTSLVLVMPLLLAGCSQSGQRPPRPEPPVVGDFATGTCREAAPDLLELGRALPRLGQDASVTQDVQQLLSDAQDRLSFFVETAPPPYAEPLAALVERIGGVRIRAVGNTYEASLGVALEQAYDDVLATCTAG